MVATKVTDIQVSLFSNNNNQQVKNNYTNKSMLAITNSSKSLAGQYCFFHKNFSDLSMLCNIFYLVQHQRHSSVEIYNIT